MTTQYLEEADRLADRIAVLDHGRIVAQGARAELKASLGGEVLRLEFAERGRTSVRWTSSNGARADDLRRTLEIDTDGTIAHVHSALGRLVAAGAAAERVSIRRPSLDDVFLTLTDRPHRIAGGCVMTIAHTLSDFEE